MSSSARRAGVELLKLIESADPGAVADVAFVYTKDVAGVTQLFAQTSDGTVYQLTPTGFGTGAAISPAAISGTVNDYSPAGLANATVVRQDVSGGAGALVTGIAGGTNLRRISFININATQANQIFFGHENVGSAAANRFTLPSALDWIIPIGGSITFIYDSTSSRWRCLSMASNVFPTGAASNPGLVIGATPTRGWRDAGSTIRGINGATDITSMGTSFGITAILAQSGGQVTFNTGSSGFVNTGPLTTTAAIAITGTTTVTLSGGTVNDWSPPITQNTKIRADTNAATIVTGLANGIDGKIAVVQNVGTVLGRDIALNHEDAGSIASNRFNLPSQVVAVIPVGGAATFIYDGTSSRWRLSGFAN